MRGYTIFTKYILRIFFYKKKPTKKPPSLILINSNHANTPNYSNSIDLTDSTNITIIPYDELWKSAIRCKLIYNSYTNVYNLWMISNNPSSTEEIIPTIDEAYIQELHGVSLPVSFHTTGDHPDIDVSIQLWHKEKTIYMTFRMKENIEAKVIKKHMKLHSIVDNICVNRFFYRRLLSVMKDMIIYFEEFKDTNYTLVISGYSVSAIMAQIASAIFAKIFPNMYVKCHTFGSPKPGNRAFSKWFLNSVKENYRVVNGNDLFPLIPIGCEWLHPVDTTLHFDNELHVNVSHRDMPWYKRIFLAHTIMKKLKKEETKRNDHHHLDKYINHLWKYKRLTSYLYSIAEAEALVHTPL